MNNKVIASLLICSMFALTACDSLMDLSDSFNESEEDSTTTTTETTLEAKTVKVRKTIWEGKVISTIEYDRDGREIKYSHDNGWETYEYDSAGKLIKNTWYFSSGNIDRVYDYEYDSEGRQIKQIRNPEYFWSVEKDLLADWTDYEYDSNGKMVKRSLWLLFKDEPDKKYSDGWYVYTYNDKGDESSISFHGPSGELWQRYEYEYEYDALGRIAKKTVIGPDIKSPDSKTYEYEYDLFGNIIKYGENTYEYEYY